MSVSECFCGSGLPRVVVVMQSASLSLSSLSLSLFLCMCLLAFCLWWRINNATSAFSLNSLHRRCCCKPTAHRNKSRDLMDLYWRSFSAVVSSAQRYSVWQINSRCGTLCLPRCRRAEHRICIRDVIEHADHNQPGTHVKWRDVTWRDVIVRRHVNGHDVTNVIWWWLWRSDEGIASLCHRDRKNKRTYSQFTRLSFTDSEYLCHGLAAWCFCQLCLSVGLCFSGMDQKVTGGYPWNLEIDGLWTREELDKFRKLSRTCSGWVDWKRRTWKCRICDQFPGPYVFS